MNENLWRADVGDGPSRRPIKIDNQFASDEGDDVLLAFPTGDPLSLLDVDSLADLRIASIFVIVGGQRLEATRLMWPILRPLRVSDLP